LSISIYLMNLKGQGFTLQKVTLNFAIKLIRFNYATSEMKIKIVK